MDSSMLQEVENSSYLVYFPFLGRKWSDGQVIIGRPPPRKIVLLQGEDKGLP